MYLFTDAGFSFSVRLKSYKTTSRTSFPQAPLACSGQPLKPAIMPHHGIPSRKVMCTLEQLGSQETVQRSVEKGEEIYK